MGYRASGPGAEHEHRQGRRYRHYKGKEYTVIGVAATARRGRTRRLPERIRRPRVVVRPKEFLRQWSCREVGASLPYVGLSEQIGDRLHGDQDDQRELFPPRR